MPDTNAEKAALMRGEATQLYQHVDAFEEAWHAGKRPVIDQFLPADGLLRRNVLIKLVHIDLENRLRTGYKARVETLSYAVSRACQRQRHPSRTGCVGIYSAAQENVRGPAGDAQAIGVFQACRTYRTEPRALATPEMLLLMQKVVQWVGHDITKRCRDVGSIPALLQPSILLKDTCTCRRKNWHAVPPHYGTWS